MSQKQSTPQTDPDDKGVQDTPGEQRGAAHCDGVSGHEDEEEVAEGRGGRGSWEREMQVQRPRGRRLQDVSVEP